MSFVMDARQRMEDGYKPICLSITSPPTNILDKFRRKRSSKRMGPSRLSGEPPERTESQQNMTAYSNSQLSRPAKNKLGSRRATLRQTVAEAPKCYHRLSIIEDRFTIIEKEISTIKLFLIEICENGMNNFQIFKELKKNYKTLLLQFKKKS
ncbi:uncharacterized protein isoform X3 [Rhodnius prolixus]|uniref:uncharacterized protein isoform X3 n=1 Tax=Rhodnius prolixus TaxID=13249 RepID=UPI003D18E78F